MNPELCAEFEEHMDALAIGELAEPEASRLLAHAASCASCQAHLDAVSGLVDSLLQLTPSVEPPPGFESRVFERLHVGVRAPSSRWRSFAVVAACIAALLGSCGSGAVTGTPTPNPAAGTTLAVSPPDRKSVV